MNQYKEAAFRRVEAHFGELSDWNQVIWHYGETALREYKSAAWYVARLKREGFEVEPGTGGMPTAFRATWRNGDGPIVAAYAEYDAVPGNCQAAATKKMPRAGLSPHAGGHTDPHSALGISALGGALAAKGVMQEHGIKGTIVLFGEPAEKVKVKDGTHWLYPGWGLDLLLGDNGEALLQYVPPPEFEQRLRVPLRNGEYRES